MEQEKTEKIKKIVLDEIDKEVIGLDQNETVEFDIYLSVPDVEKLVRSASVYDE